MKYIIAFLLLTSTAHAQTYTDILANGDTVITTISPAQFVPASITRVTRPFKPPVVEPPVTPGKIEGFGAGVTGGEGYPVRTVTALTETALRNAIGTGNCIVKFAVSGTIRARLNFTNLKNCTIDGEGKITIDNNNNGDGLSFETAGCTNIIVKNLRVRNAGNDCIAITGANNIVIDHCSVGGSSDGGIDITKSYNVTVQYCILGPGRSDWAGSMLIAYSPTRNVSIHHNLMISATPGGVGERNPMVHYSGGSVGSYLVADIRNNAILNWGRNGGTGSGYGTAIAFGATANVVNNWYSDNETPGSAAQPNDGYGSNPGKAYIAGNVVAQGNNVNTKSNASEFAVPAAARITVEDAVTAARRVKSEAGCYPLDDIDKKLIAQIVIQ